MSLGSLGVFLFRNVSTRTKKVSNLNSTLYQIENSLPHLVRTQQFIDELDQNREPETDLEAVPKEVETITVDDVHFSYQAKMKRHCRASPCSSKKANLLGLSAGPVLENRRLRRYWLVFYQPDSGEIRANGRSIHDMSIDEWRKRIAVVRQDPFIFNDTLRYNLTIGNRDVSEEELDKVMRIAKVDEFFAELPDGYETRFG